MLVSLLCWIFFYHPNDIWTVVCLHTEREGGTESVCCKTYLPLENWGKWEWGGSAVALTWEKEENHTVHSPQPLFIWWKRLDNTESTTQVLLPGSSGGPPAQTQHVRYSRLEQSTYTHALRYKTDGFAQAIIQVYKYCKTCTHKHAHTHTHCFLPRRRIGAQQQPCFLSRGHTLTDSRRFY